jgi:hypothetical protein
MAFSLVVVTNMLWRKAITKGAEHGQSYSFG